MKFPRPVLAILLRFTTARFAQTSNGSLREAYYDISGGTFANLSRHQTSAT